MFPWCIACNVHPFTPFGNWPKAQWFAVWGINAGSVYSQRKISHEWFPLNKLGIFVAELNEWLRSFEFEFILDRDFQVTGSEVADVSDIAREAGFKWH